MGLFKRNTSTNEGETTMSEALKAVEINCATGEVTERPLTAEEIQQREVDAQAAAERKAQEDADLAIKEGLKASAKAKLAALLSLIHI